MDDLLDLLQLPLSSQTFDEFLMFSSILQNIQINNEEDDFWSYS